MRNGKISMPNMITQIVEDRQRNQMLVELVKKASAGTRQLSFSVTVDNTVSFFINVFPRHLDSTWVV
jgi:hypothetical protein